MRRRDVPITRELFERARWRKNAVVIDTETEFERIHARTGFVMPSEKDRKVQSRDRQGTVIALGPDCDDQVQIGDRCWYARFAEGQEWESQNYEIEGRGQCIAVCQGNVLAVER